MDASVFDAPDVNVTNATMELKAMLRGGHRLRLELDPIEALAIATLLTTHPGIAERLSQPAREAKAKIEAFFREAGAMTIVHRIAGTG